MNNQKVCQHYLQGKCKYGANCRNIHPPQAGGGASGFGAGAPGGFGGGAASGFGAAAPAQGFVQTGQVPGFNQQGGGGGRGRGRGRGQNPNQFQQGMPASGFGGMTGGQFAGANQMSNQVGGGFGPTPGFNTGNPVGFGTQPAGFNPQGAATGFNPQGTASGFNQQGPGGFNQQFQQNHPGRRIRGQIQNANQASFVQQQPQGFASNFQQQPQPSMGFQAQAYPVQNAQPTGFGSTTMQMQQAPTGFGGPTQSGFGGGTPASQQPQGFGNVPSFPQPRTRGPRGGSQISGFNVQPTGFGGAPQGFGAVGMQNPAFSHQQMDGMMIQGQQEVMAQPPSFPHPQQQGRQMGWASSGPASQPTAANPNAKPCRDWIKSGTCRFGNRCRFRHDMQTGDSLENSEAPMVLEADDQSAVESNYGFNVVEDEFTAEPRDDNTKPTNPSRAPPKRDTFSRRLEVTPTIKTKSLSSEMRGAALEQKMGQATFEQGKLSREEELEAFEAEEFQFGRVPENVVVLFS